MGPLNAEPGSRWEYGCSIDWAGLAVEKVSGMDLDAYFKVSEFVEAWYYLILNFHLSRTETHL